MKARNDRMVDASRRDVYSPSPGTERARDAGCTCPQGAEVHDISCPLRRRFPVVDRKALEGLRQ